MTQGEGKGQKRGREAVEADSLLPSSSSDRVRSVSVAFYPSIPSSSPSFQTLGLLRLVLHSHVILFFRLPSICPFSLSLSASSTILLAKVLAFSFWFSPFLDGCVLPLLFLSAPSPTRAAFPPTPFAASPPPSPSPAQCSTPPLHWNSKVNQTPTSALAHGDHGLMEESDPAADCPG